MKTPSRLSHKLVDQIRFLLITKSSSPSKISSTECKIKGIVIKVKITPIGIPIKTNQPVFRRATHFIQEPLHLKIFRKISKFLYIMENFSFFIL